MNKQELQDRQEWALDLIDEKMNLLMRRKGYLADRRYREDVDNEDFDTEMGGILEIERLCKQLHNVLKHGDDFEA